MKRFFLNSAVCVFAFSGVVFAPQVFAQGANTITVIHEDGSQDVIELGGSAPKPAPQRSPSVEVETDTPAQSVIFKEPSEVAPPEVVPESAAEPVGQPEIKPAPAPKPAKKAKPKPKKKAQAAPKKVKQDPLALIPPRKPHRRALPAGAPITKEKALYIALSEAPPAKDVQVIPRESAGGLEYAVIFKTEEGGYEVIVDGLSGVIISSGKLSSDQPLTKPGHLPVR